MTVPAECLSLSLLLLLLFVLFSSFFAVVLIMREVVDLKVEDDVRDEEEAALFWELEEQKE